MRIVILGGGTVGRWIAETLCRHHSVTIVDTDPNKIRSLNNELDVMAITGNASHSSTLFQADVLGVDLCLAVTGQEEVNILAASITKEMGARRTIARVTSDSMLDSSTFDYQWHFGVDRLLSLEELTAVELAREIRNPGSVDVEHVARGALKVQEVYVTAKSKLVGRPIKDIDVPSGVRLGCISRGDDLWLASATDVLEVEDQVLLIGDDAAVDSFRDEIQKDRRKLNVMIAGGGFTGVYLAKILDPEHYSVTLLERSPERCEELAQKLPTATLLNIDATQRKRLQEEHVEGIDVFVACMGEDENNIMAGVEAGDLGAKKVLCVVGRPDYALLMSQLGIDKAVSPREAMVEQVKTFLNEGAIISHTQLHEGNIGVYEIEIQEGSPACEHILANLELPSGKCLIAAVVHEGQVRVPRPDDHFAAGDYIVALIEDSAVDATLDMFSVTGR